MNGLPRVPDLGTLSESAAVWVAARAALRVLPYFGPADSANLNALREAVDFALSVSMHHESHHLATKRDLVGQDARRAVRAVDDLELVRDRYSVEKASHSAIQAFSASYVLLEKQQGIIHDEYNSHSVVQHAAWAVQDAMNATLSPAGMAEIISHEVDALNKLVDTDKGNIPVLGDNCLWPSEPEWHRKRLDFPAWGSVDKGTE